MKTLCIVPCGARKIWDKDPGAGPTAAKYVYIGPFASKCQEYAEKFYPGDWVILSAKYGFLLPEDIVPGPYNVSFKYPNSKPVTLEELKRIALEKRLLGYERVVVLGGKGYVGMAEKVFTNQEIVNPLEGCKGNGYMMGKMKRAMEEGTR